MVTYVYNDTSLVYVYLVVYSTSYRSMYIYHMWEIFGIGKLVNLVNTTPFASVLHANHLLLL